jgi:hypothetical protein
VTDAVVFGFVWFAGGFAWTVLAPSEVEAPAPSNSSAAVAAAAHLTALRCPRLPSRPTTR